MLAFQRPLKEITDRYKINLDESNKQGKRLYNLTAGKEKQYTLLRFVVYFSAFGLIFAPLIAIFLLVAFAFSMGSMFSDEGGGMGFFLIVLFLILAWIIFAYHSASSNTTNSEKDRLKNSDDGREIAWALGARDHSHRERNAIEMALTQIHGSKGSDVAVHANWWVIDSELAQAVTLGNDLYITTGAIKSNYLVPLVAHELGHLANSDGWTLASLRSFISPVLRYRLTSFARLHQGVLTGQQTTVSDIKGVAQSLDASIASFLYMVWFGGNGVMQYSTEWSQWFRDRDYLADDFVVKLGLGDQLVTFLEQNPQMTLAVPFSANWSQYNELRIDRILLLRSLATPNP